MKKVNELIETKQKGGERRINELKHGIPMTEEELKTWEHCFTDVVDCFEDNEEEGE